MTDSEHVHHAIDYIEFVVTDMAPSQRFHGSGRQRACRLVG